MKTQVKTGGPLSAMIRPEQPMDSVRSSDTSTGGETVKVKTHVRAGGGSQANGGQDGSD